MSRIVLLVLFITVNAKLSSQNIKISENGPNIYSRKSYYPNETLNLVTLGIVNGKKYFFTDVEASWYEASYFCNAHGMDLASIETEHENDLIMEHIAKLGFTDRPFWISGHKIGTSSWLWINGAFIIFSDWGTGEPTNPDYEHCIRIYKGKWMDGVCESLSGFICEEREIIQGISSEQRSIYPNDLLNMVNLDPTTGKKYLFANASKKAIRIMCDLDYNAHCKEMFKSQRILTVSQWIGASYFCNAHGLDLVTIDTQQENDLIVAHIESLGMSQLMFYWTSLHQIERPTWRWINGESLTYSDWAPGYPTQTSQHCMRVHERDWKDTDCRNGILQTAFICETRKSLPGYDAQSTTAAAMYYPADMMNLVTLGPGNGTKYLIAQETASWFDASNFCNAHGMDLVTIETLEENVALVEYIANEGLDNFLFFTSGHKIGRATYLWINGEYMLYNGWALGEPSYQEYYNCMVLFSNEWYDHYCFDESYFICEERVVQ